ncbi:TRAP transporter large permease subunit [Myxococcota bacterium]|nr:TRAP transporter large permease subunit [Myxococcota bacterium]
MIIVLALLVFLAAIGAPLFVIVGAITAASLALFTEFSRIEDMRVLIQHMEGLATRQEFLAIPLFMASGAIMTAGGIARRLVELMRALLVGLPGGVAVASVAACMFFAAISGSSPVTLIAVGSMMVPALVKNRYPEDFSIGLVTTAGSLGCLVPPSMAMLIYAISVSGSSTVDPSDLFLAGLVPAMLVAGLLAIFSVFEGLKLHVGHEKLSGAQIAEKARAASWAIFLPVLVLGGIYGGWYTPSQAGAVAVVYSLFVTVWVHRELTWKQAFAAMMQSAQLMGTLLPIIVLAFGLNELLALLDVQEKLMEAVRALDPSPAGFLLGVNLVLIVLGALMDSISATLIFAPLLAPMANEMFGIDPIHFGIIFVVNMEIGYLAPPVATNLFVASAIFRKPFGFVSKAVLPTLGLTIVALGIIIYVPTVSLAALNLRDGKPLWSSFPWDGPPKEVIVEDDTTKGTPTSTAAPSLKSLTGKIAGELQGEGAVPSLKSLTGKIAGELQGTATATASAAQEAAPSGPPPSLKMLTKKIAGDLETASSTTAP